MGRTNWEKSKQGVIICKKSTKFRDSMPAFRYLTSREAGKLFFLSPERIATASPPKAAVTSPSLTNHISIIMCIIIGTRSSLGSIELCQRDFERLFSLLNWTHHRGQNKTKLLLTMCTWWAQMVSATCLECVMSSGAFFAPAWHSSASASSSQTPSTTWRES